MVQILIAIVLSALVVAAASVPGATRASAAPPASDPPPLTANPFLPEQQNVSDCLGSLERPGCGSEERGGWRQTLVFVIIALGMAFVFTMVVREVRRSRRSQERDALGHDA